MFQAMADFFMPHTESPVIWEQDSLRLVLHDISLTDLPPEKFVNWKKNRPPDPVRVEEMARYFELNDVRLVPGVIYVWVCPHSPQFYVYDGIHRLRAAFQTRHTMQALVLYRETAREQEIIDDFLHLNKSIAVPSIYLEEPTTQSDHKKKVCVSVVDQLCRRYAAFLSPSRKPSRHNFNRDLFLEHMSTWNVDFEHPDFESRFLHAFTQLNTRAKTYVDAHPKLYVPRKCEQYDFYVFFLPGNVIQQHMEEYIWKNV